MIPTLSIVRQTLSAYVNTPVTIPPSPVTDTYSAQSNMDPNTDPDLETNIVSLLNLPAPTPEQLVQLKKLLATKFQHMNNSLEDLKALIEQKQAQIDILLMDQKEKDDTIRDLLDNNSDASSISMMSAKTTDTKTLNKEAPFTPATSKGRKRRGSSKP